MLYELAFNWGVHVMTVADSGKPAAGKLIHCPVCGKSMTIPPGYENTPGKCPGCGATVNDGTESLVDMLDPPVVATRRDASLQKQVPVAAESLWRSLALSSLWGFAAGGGGAVLTMVVMTVRKGFASDFSVTALISGAGYGLTIGFVLAFGWALNRRRALNVWTSALAAGIAAAFFGTSSYLVEWVAVAPPDFGIPETALMNLLGGAVIGIILWYCSAWWDEHS